MDLLSSIQESTSATVKLVWYRRYPSKTTKRRKALRDRRSQSKIPWRKDKQWMSQYLTLSRSQICSKTARAKFKILPSNASMIQGLASWPSFLLEIKAFSKKRAKWVSIVCSKGLMMTFLVLTPISYLKSWMSLNLVLIKTWYCFQISNWLFCLQMGSPCQPSIHW